MEARLTILTHVCEVTRTTVEGTVFNDFDFGEDFPQCSDGQGLPCTLRASEENTAYGRVYGVEN